MRKLLYILSIVIITTNAFAQVPSIQWQKSLGGTNSEEGNSIQQTSDGGYILAGESNSNDGDVTVNHGGDDIWIVKLDNSGALQWQKSLGGSEHEGAESIQQTTDGGFIVVGTSTSIDGDITGGDATGNIWVVKLNDTGVIQWQKSIGSTGGDRGYSVQQTNDGGYIVLGSVFYNDGDVTGHHGSFNNDYWVVKLNSTGTIQWQKCFGGTSGDGDDANGAAIKQTSDGGYIFAGSSYSNDGDVIGHHGTTGSLDYWIVKINSSGVIEWQKSLGGSGDDYGYSIKQTTDGGYIVGAGTNSTDGDAIGNDGSHRFWVVKLYSNGNFEWQNFLGSSGGAYFIDQTNDGGYIATGLSTYWGVDISDNHDSTICGPCGDYWVVKLDNIGNLIWEKSLGGSGYEFSQEIQETSDGGIVVIGTAHSNDGDISGFHGIADGFNSDCWVVKLQCNQVLNITQNGDTLFAYPPWLNYQWYLNDTLISEANDQTYVITEGGNYYATGSNGNNCSAISNLIEASCLCVGINENELVNKFMIYPNPVKSQITVSGYSPAYIKLCDTVGQTVAESKGNKLYVGNLSQGLYVLQLFDANGQQVKTKKVIVAK